jgi:hypothetical protein
MLTTITSTVGACSENEDITRPISKLIATTIASSPRKNPKFFFRVFYPNRTASLLEKNPDDMINH